MLKNLLARLRDPSLMSMDVDGTERLRLHRIMLDKKPMLREVFTEFHHTFRSLDERFFSANGSRIELGAGIAPVRDSYPDVLATDVVYGPHLDRVINAEKMGLPDASVRAFYGQNCFHHLPHPDQFFLELDRVLAPGGGVILLEPYYGPIASFMFKRLFKTEGFDKKTPLWDTPIAGPMNGANQALSFIIFIRDRTDFTKKQPTLKIVHQELCSNHIKYLLSGGLNFKQLCPSKLSPIINIIQRILSPFNRWTSLHHIIIIRKELE